VAQVYDHVGVRGQVAATRTPSSGRRARCAGWWIIGTADGAGYAIFAKLELYPGDMSHRRVLAVLRYLGEGPQPTAPKP
jgi:hypothetical protein